MSGPIPRGSDYAELAAFLAVAEAGNFARAASRLGVSRSALSHTIRALEERVGTRLFNRTTRSVALTDAGRSLQSRLPPAFAEIAQAVESLRDFRDQPSGIVRLNVLRLGAEMLLSDALPRFAKAYPDVEVQLTIDDELTDIVAGGFDAGIRPGELVQKDMIAVRVTPPLRAAIVGSPGYFERHPVPRHPRDLADHVCVNYHWKKTGTFYRWPFERDGEVMDVAVTGPISVNDSGLTTRAALYGAGLACTLEGSIRDELADGRLIRVLEDWCPPLPGFFLYYPSRRHMPPGLRALIDFLKVEG